MTVNCFKGGYDGRFGRTENSKEDLEYRTKPKDWGIDTSLYGKASLSAHEVMQIEDPVEKALALQDLQARLARKNFKRTTPRNAFSGDDYEFGHYW
ncbi:hypothetical protein HKCCA1058_04065 [Rhodobacterales bacterium HKCCA1058]|nr:hypothetical protein [Rhodobacterales bacterium HKCCA1058]